VAGILGRLICNLLVGMVAIEGGRKSITGEIFNDLPDRIADPLILVAAGYAVGVAWGIELGWLAAVLALLTAYVRVLGQSAGAGIYFIGPMAKQHRMATLTAACLLAVVACWRGWDGIVLAAALGVICAGCAITIVRRLRRIAADLERR
jgi:phosphatidylglycerophosphate synthase